MILDNTKLLFLKVDKIFFKGRIEAFYSRNFKYRGKAYLLNKEMYFPPHTAANKKIRLGPAGELLAIGGDLTPERMIYAYKNGICPCFYNNEPILWWTSEIRCVIYPKDIHISKIVRRFIKQKNFSLTVDKAFSEVVIGCTEGRIDNTWLTPERIVASSVLHDVGFSHSIEVWQEEKLVAGLFGITFGTYFFVASKFTRVNHASKVAMIALAIRMEELNYTMMDCGIWPTDHLKSMGAVIITRDEFLKELNQCSQMPDAVEKWEDLFEKWDLSIAIRNHDIKMQEKQKNMDTL
ncbi:leucyl/phenylalanyl-tRNA--protein transferase [Acetobacterium woodii]|nr:leucyl/phenylalanyl-tRNA--protein transferase [Acetobacterium woodii]